ncbi:MAG: hypothetical protein HUU37_09730, partial [Bdellovibrionales bacterium]|nr:hypothetical protein [Bdellovibrionales bacterium]
MDPGISKENVAEAVRLYVFPGKPGPKFAEKERFVTIYEDWKRYWADLLAGIGSGDRIPRDEFFKQDYVAALMHGHEIVGTICINSYDSECGLFEHTFFQTFDDDFYRHMQGR